MWEKHNPHQLWATEKMNQKGKEKLNEKNPTPTQTCRPCQTFRLGICCLLLFLCLCCGESSKSDYDEKKRGEKSRAERRKILSWIFVSFCCQLVHLICFFRGFYTFRVLLSVSLLSIWNVLCCMLFAAIKSRQKAIEKKETFNFKRLGSHHKIWKFVFFSGFSVVVISEPSTYFTPF